MDAIFFILRAHYQQPPFAVVWCSQKFAFRSGDFLYAVPANFWVTINKQGVSVRSSP
jgi:hypothetical protein